MKRSETTNTFQDGLLMDLNPLVTPNNVVTNCLNGTLITYNGNENVLQNDMGNGRVETAYLPEGYVPLGTAQLGGIVYIVSYNPLSKQCQIGSFPSPERNFYLDTVKNKGSGETIQESDFIKAYTSDLYNGENVITSTLVKRILDNDITIYPGDQFKVVGSNLSDKTVTDYGNTEEEIGLNPRDIRFHIASIDDNEKIAYLDDKLKWFDVDGGGKYFIHPGSITINDEVDVDEYRSVVSSNYNVFQNNSAGKLAIIGELEVIDTFSATWETTEDSKLQFYANWTSSHPNINPKEIRVKVKDKEDSTISIQKKRKNDGSDNDIPILKKDLSTLGSGLISYTIVPKMSLGFLDNLKVTGTIDPSKIGTGEAELTQWKYYAEDSVITLDFGLDVYPKPKTNIDKVTIEFYDINDLTVENLTGLKDFLNGEKQFVPSPKDSSLSASFSTNKSPSYTYTIKNRKSFSGYYQIKIKFDNTQLLSNKCYLARVAIISSDNTKYNYRIVYTSKQFNIAYSSYEDFGTLSLNEYLSIKSFQGAVNKSLINYESKLSKSNLRYDAESNTSKEVNIIDTQKNSITAHYKTYPEYGEGLFNITPLDISKITISGNSTNEEIENLKSILYNSQGNLDTELTAPIKSIKSEYISTTNNGDFYTIKFDVDSIITTPLKVFYNNSTEPVPLDRYFEKLSINPVEYYMILIGVKSGGHYIILREDNTIDDNGRLGYFKLHDGDKGILTSDFKGLGELYNIITEQAQYYDITIVPIELGRFDGANQRFDLTHAKTNVPIAPHNGKEQTLTKTFIVKTLNGWQLYSAYKDITKIPEEEQNLKEIKKVRSSVETIFKDYYKLQKADTTSTIAMYKSNNVQYFPTYNTIQDCIINIPEQTLQVSVENKYVDLNSDGSLKDICNFQFNTSTGSSITVPIDIQVDTLDHVNSVLFVDTSLVGVKNDNDTFSYTSSSATNTGVIYKKESEDNFSEVLEITKDVTGAGKVKYPCKVINNTLSITKSDIIKDDLSVYYYCDDEGIKLRLFK